MSKRLFASAVAVVVASSMPHVAAADTVRVGLVDIGLLDSEEPVMATDVISRNAYDIVSFSISGVNDLSATLQNYVSYAGGKTYNFSSLTATLYKGAYTVTPGTGTLLGSVSAGSTVTYSALEGGDYYAMVEGTRAVGASGGQYGLSLFAAAPAAPAPGPGGALVAGAALAAFMISRSRKAKTTVAA